MGSNSHPFSSYGGARLAFSAGRPGPAQGFVIVYSYQGPSCVFVTLDCPIRSSVIVPSGRVVRVCTVVFQPGCRVTSYVTSGRISMLYRLAEALAIPVTDLLTGGPDTAR